VQILAQQTQDAWDEPATALHEHNYLVEQLQFQSIQAFSSDRSSRQRERHEATVRAEEPYDAALTYQLQEMNIDIGKQLAE